MIVESLRHQLQRQLVSNTGRFLHLGTLVLEPDLDLGLVESQFAGEGLTAVFRQVLAVIELSFESVQLAGSERSPRPLLVRVDRRRAVLLLRLA